MPHCLMCSVKCSGKLAISTPLFLWLNFITKKPFSILKCLRVITVLLTVLALILLYGGHCSSVWLPSKVTLRLPASRNNAPKHTMMFPSSLITA